MYIQNNQLNNFNYLDQNRYESLIAEDLDCYEHKLPKKYWSVKECAFFCEHDSSDLNELVHYRSILDKYIDDIKQLKLISVDKNKEHSSILDSIYPSAQSNFQTGYKLINNFSEFFKNFSNSYFGYFHDIKNQENEISKLKELIDNINFLSNGKADYIGIGKDGEREKNFLRLAKLLICRNYQQKNNLHDSQFLSNNLTTFIKEFKIFLITLAADSERIFHFTSNELLQSLIKLDPKNFDKSLENLRTPIVLREELDQLKESLTYHMNVNNVLTNKIAYLENENKNTSLKYESIFDKNNILIAQLQNEIENLKVKHQNQLCFADNQYQELSLLRDRYEKKFQEFELTIQNLQNTIKDLNLKIEQLKQNETEMIKKAQFLEEENSKLKSAYEMRIKDNLTKISSIEASLQNEKNNFEVQKNNLLNTIENHKKKTSDLNNEIIALNEKREHSLGVIETCKNEIEYLKEWKARAVENHKIELQSLIKQNEISSLRIEELERILSLSNQKSDQILFINSKFNEHKGQYDDLFIQKELMEKDLIDKKNKITQLQLHIEASNMKFDSLNSELNSLKEQNKSYVNVHNNIKAYTSQLEQANSNCTKVEIENSELKNKLSKSLIELNQMNIRLEDDQKYIANLQNEINQLRHYDKKLELLTNSKMEIDKLKSKFDYTNNNNNNNNNYNKDNKDNYPNNCKSSASFSNNKNLEYISPVKEPGQVGQVDFYSSKPGIFQEEVPLYQSNGNNFYSSSKSLGKNSLSNFNSLDNNISLRTSLNNLNTNTLLVNQKNWSTLKNWFETLNIANSKRIKLNLLMKASIDGFDATVFREKCHKKPSTMIVLLTSYDKLIGGYTPIPWNNGEYNYIADPSKKTFLFSLTNQKFYPLINVNYAICHGADIGPIFGGGSDLEVVSNCDKNYNNFSGIGHSFKSDETEESFYGSKKYLVKDYEVYEVNY